MAYQIHSFDVSLDEAQEIQRNLRTQVIVADTMTQSDIDIVGGADIAFIADSERETVASRDTAGADAVRAVRRFGGHFHDNRVTALAAIVTIDIRTNRVIEKAYAEAPVYFPYIPGFLSFREGPAVLAALKELRVPPSVMIYDGCGIAHQRGIGLASHMAVLTGIPSVGCAKSLLCGTCPEPSPSRGDWTEIRYKDSVVGSCLRTRENVRPVYVSPGSGFGIDGARELVMMCVDRYRLPEPTRLAHAAVTARKKELRNAGNEARVI